MKKKVLIITYYWPPGGGAGVQRWLKFVKYLPQHGWQPVVYTPLNGEMPVLDASLEKDIPPGTIIIKTPIREPYAFYKKLVGAGKGERINTGFLTEKKRPGLAEKISVWIRGNLFIPDARCLWISPSVRYLKKWLKENPVDAIVSSGPPHSMHLIASKLSKDTGIPWLADFRDPWTNIDYYPDLMLTTAADRKHHRLEEEVVRGASRVVVVGNSMREEFETKYRRPVTVITNGYDEEDRGEAGVADTGKFVMAHIGTLVRSRNPENLWLAIRELTDAQPAFASKLSIRLTGKVDLSVRESLRKLELERFVTYVDYLPHDQVGREQQSASVLLLILNNTPNARGIITGKLFEYLASLRPVLCIGPPDGDAAAILNESGGGTTCNFDDLSSIKQTLSDLFNRYLQQENITSGSNIEQYSRKSLTAKLVGVLEEMT